jgi:hypothetical protein
VILAGCSNNPPAQTPPAAQPTTVVSTPAPPTSPPGTTVANAPQELSLELIWYGWTPRTIVVQTDLAYIDVVETLLV